MNHPALAKHYAQHVRERLVATERILQAQGYDHLLIASGRVHGRFLDDQSYPFYANPHFRAWVPINLPDCWIAITPGRKPVLAYFQADDYWHVPPNDPQGYWVEHFDVRTIRDPQHARAQLPQVSGRAAILGEADAACGGLVPNNPERLLHALHLLRTRKTEYEVECLRQANLLAVRGQRAAAAGFRAHRSEFEIHMAYCGAVGQGEHALPYGNIVALNAHAATLHYQHQDLVPPPRHHSLLLDAGAQVHGYAADVTRTYGDGDAVFSALLEAITHAQLKLVEQARVGQDFRDLHLEAHRALAQILKDQGIVRAAPESQVETGISSAFFPHGLGHFLGLQVHDVAGFLKDDSGATLPKPEGHPYLRLTRTLERDNVLTIEPGLYFIDALLEPLRQGPHRGEVDWAKVEHLRPYGGIRIEDNVRVTDGAPENLTRDAFKALAVD